MKLVDFDTVEDCRTAARSTLLSSVSRVAVNGFSTPPLGGLELYVKVSEQPFSVEIIKTLENVVCKFREYVWEALDVQHTFREVSKH